MIERINYRGWNDCYRLSNSAVEAVVVPSVGRIMHFGHVSGPNLLWENERVAGRPPAPGVWSNYGGNKVWIWPQSDWPLRVGRDWPPATDEPGVIEHSAEIADALTLRVTSARIPGFGVRTLREIRVAENGARLAIESRIERLDAGPAFPLAAWTVTQMPCDGRLLARLLSSSRLPQGYRLFDGSAAFAAVERLPSGLLAIRRPKDRWAKLGLDGDLLAWQRGADLFVERSADSVSRLSDFKPGDRAQVYSHADGDASLPSGLSYVELELTSPLVTLGVGEALTLQTTWDLVRLAPEDQTGDAAARRLTLL